MDENHESCGLVGVAEYGLCCLAKNEQILFSVIWLLLYGFYGENDDLMIQVEVENVMGCFEDNVNLV